MFKEKKAYAQARSTVAVNHILDVVTWDTNLLGFDGDKYQRIDKSKIQNLVWIFDKTLGYATFTVEVE